MSTYQFFTILFLLVTSMVFSQTTINHKVRKGESFYSIAKKYDIKENAIYDLNPKVKGKLLKLNAVLLIPNKKADSSSLNLSQVQNHKVVSGETLYKISKKYGTSIQELERLNPSIVNKLPIGYSLILREEIPIVEHDSIAIETEAIVESSPEIVVENSNADFLIEAALRNLGIKYRRGGASKKGFDCSGLIFTTYKELDITLPRSSHEQAKTGTKVKRSEAQKGDLIFFSTNNRGTISHVGMITEIFEDEIKFIHSSTHQGVIVSSTSESYYAKRFKQINSVLQSFF